MWVPTSSCSWYLGAAAAASCTFVEMKSRGWCCRGGAAWSSGALRRSLGAGFAAAAERLEVGNWAMTPRRTAQLPPESGSAPCHPARLTLRQALLLLVRRQALGGADQLRAAGRAHGAGPVDVLDAQHAAGHSARVQRPRVPRWLGGGRGARRARGAGGGPPRLGRAGCRALVRHAACRHGGAATARESRRRCPDERLGRSGGQRCWIGVNSGLVRVETR